MAALLLPSLLPNSSVASHWCARESKTLVGKTGGPAGSLRKTTWPEFRRDGLWRSTCSHSPTIDKSSPSTASRPNELQSSPENWKRLRHISRQWWAHTNHILGSNIHSAEEKFRVPLQRCSKLYRRWLRLIASGVERPAYKGLLETMEGTVVIAGGGPAGCLMAHYMLRRGFSVQLFEKREAAKLGDSYEQIYSRDDIRSFPMTITTRALKPLDAAEVKLPTTLAHRLKGGTRHFGGGKKVDKRSLEPYTNWICFVLDSNDAVTYDLVQDSEHESYTVSRNALAGYMQHTLSRRYAGGLSMHFGWELVRISDTDNIATFKRVIDDKTSGKGELLEVHYDLLIGADGANSAVRKEILRLDQLQTSNESRDSAITEEITENPNCYKSFHISREIAAKSPLYQELNRIQSWARIDMLLVVGMADGSFWGCSTSPKLVNESNPEIVRSILREEAPEILELVLEEDSNWCEKFVAQPSINGGKAVILSRFHKGNIVVIGDAAHAMFPVYGTGCNAALEDCAIIDNILTNLLKDGKEKDVLNQVGAEFTKERILDAHTIVKLNVTRELFSNTKLDFYQRSFFKALHLWFPKVIQRPAGQCLSGTTRFSSIRKLKQRQNLIFYSFLIVLALALGFTGYKLARTVSSNLIPLIVK